MLKEFLYLNINDEVNVDDILWNNSLIKYKGKMLYFKRWIKQGIIFVNQILDKDNNVIKYDHLCNMINDNGNLMFEYNAIVNALERVQFKNSNQVSFKIGNKMLKSITTKDISGTLIERDHIVPISNHFWERKYPNYIFCWEAIWKNVFLCINEARVRSLQWKILHNIYPTNILLYKMKKIDTMNCLSCAEIDFIEHFFCECKIVKPLWQEVEDLAKIKYGKIIKLQNTDILFGKDVESPKKFTYLNSLILIAKMCISKFKYGQHPNILYLFTRECKLRKINHL